MAVNPPDALDVWLSGHYDAAPPATPQASPPLLAPGDKPQPDTVYVPKAPDEALPDLAANPDVGGDPTKDTTTTFDPTIDYSKLFDFFGIPDDIKAKIQQLIAQAHGDVGQATPLILAYIRGTDWYAKTYSGIQYGVAAGLFGSNPEADYRSYVNSANQFYKQYLNRDVSTDEIVNALKEGVGVDILGKRLQGQSYAAANSQGWQYELGAFGDQGQTDAAGVKALGYEAVGLNSNMGDKLQEQLDKAHKRLSTIVQGTLATQSLSRGPRGNLGSNPNQPSDIGA